jgi:hypothetical protein
MQKGLVLFAVVSLGCSKDVGANAQGQSAVASSVPNPGIGKKAEVTPELSEKARSILEEQPDAPLGTTVPFSLDGKDYIARFEEHENAEGDPDRPPGKHKGVTVYERSP